MKLFVTGMKKAGREEHLELSSAPTLIPGGNNGEEGEQQEGGVLQGDLHITPKEPSLQDRKAQGILRAWVSFSTADSSRALVVCPALSPAHWSP